MSLIKTCKKISCFIAVVLALCFLAGCQPVEPSPRVIAKQKAEAAVNEISQALLWDPTAMSGITTAQLNLTTTTKYKNVTISWASSAEDVIAVDGTVNRLFYTDSRAYETDGMYVIPVKLTATITGTYSYASGDQTVEETVETQKEFNFTVRCVKPDSSGTIAEVKADAWKYIYETKGVDKALISASSTTYNVDFTGVVTAKLLNGGMGLMVHDGTEGIYVYTANADFEIGDTVYVVGNIYTYYGSLQVGSDITIKKVDPVEGVQPGEFREITVQEWEDEQADLDKSIGYFGGKLVKVYAKLEKSSNPSTSDIYKLVDPYTGEVAWVYYKSYEAGNTELDAWDGKHVYIYGATYDRDSRLVKNHLLWNGQIEEAPAPELTPAQKMEQVKAQLGALAGSYVCGTKFALPAEIAEFGATISWKLSDETLLANGAFALVEKDTDLTATATITLGDLTETYEVAIKVLKLTTYTVAAASKLEKDTVVKLVGTVEVVYSSYNNFYLKDATGNLLVYKSLPAGVKLGDRIELVGKIAYYNGTPQIGTIISTTVVSSQAWEMTAPKEATIAEIVAYTQENAEYGQYLRVTGKLVLEGKYYYLVDSADATKKISLYNSTVDAEKLVAAAGTETEVTLFVYFYGNSKSNWSEGEKRVIFVQREGEYFVGDEEVILPAEREYKTLAEAKALVGQEVTVRGVVTAVAPYSTQYGNFGVLIEDATDGLYLYRVTGEDSYAKFVVGQEIEVKGTMDCYNGLYEMKNVQMDSFKVVNANATIPGPTPMSNELQDQGKVVVLTEAVWNGSAFEKDGSTYAYFYSSSWLAEKPELVKGATYNFKGWLNWYNAPQFSPLAAPELVKEPGEAPAHEHTACPECGKCTAADCDGAEEEKCQGHEVEPEATDKVELNPDVLGLGAYADGSKTVAGVEFSFIELGSYGNGIQWRNKTKASTLWNTTAFAKPIAKVVLVYNAEKATYANANALKVEFGTDSSVSGYSTFISTEKGKIEYTITPDAETYTFVKFTINITYSMYFDSITIYYADGSVAPELPKHEHTACPECGKCTAADCDGAEADKCQGHEVEPELPSPEAGTATLTVADAAAANGWDSSANNLSAPYAIDENISISIAGGSNSGKFYTDHLRVYATDSPAGSITITAKEGYKIKSVSFGLVTGTYAFLQYNGVTVENGQVVEVGAASAVFETVKNGSNGKQVRVLSVTVVYEAE